MEHPNKSSGLPWKKRGEEPKAHEATGMMRWLLTYADMLTLLFALFVILYAISKPQIQHIIEVQQSVAQAFHGQPTSLTQVYQAMMDSNRMTPEEKAAQVQDFIEYLKENSKQTQVQEFLQQNPNLAKELIPSENTTLYSPLRPLEIIQGQIKQFVGENHLEGAMKATIIPERGLVIELLSDGVLFDSGMADLKPQARKIIKQVVMFIKKDGITNQIRVDGHTDTVPIRGGPYKDNLALSVARAVTVWRYMYQLGLPANQISAAGYGPYRPIASNATEAGRRKNRRVEITIPPAEKGKVNLEGNLTDNNGGQPVKKN